MDLFIGSSQIAFWPLPKTTVVKRVHFSRELFDKRLPIHKNVGRIVIYCGSNDILRGIDPIENILRFVDLLVETYPASEIIVLGILKSPRAFKFHDVITRANHRLKRGLPEKVRFLNLNRSLVHPKYYREDGLHLNMDGYYVWERAIWGSNV
jgi:lysophospholipase L1-like esterase